MRVLVAFVIAVSVAACAGRSIPDAAPAPEVAATDEAPKTVDAGTLTANEQFCEMRSVTGSIMKKRVCRGRSAGVDEVVGQEQIRDTLQGMEHARTGSGMVIR